MKGRALVVLAVATASVVAGLGGAPPAKASLSGCDEEVQRPFLRWLDPMQYYLMPGGSLESPAGWALRDAKLTRENEPFHVNSRSDNSSLYLGPGASAVSPWTCVGLAEPTVRFFAVSSGGLLSTLTVTPQYRDRNGTIRSLMPIPVLGLAHGSWSPTLPLPIALSTVLNDVLTLDLRSTDVRFVFTSSSGLLSAGKWRIDDIYVDPATLKW